MTQTVDSCIVANIKLRVCLWRVSLEWKSLKEPGKEQKVGEAGFVSFGCFTDESGLYSAARAADVSE